MASAVASQQDSPEGQGLVPKVSPIVYENSNVKKAQCKKGFRNNNKTKKIFKLTCSNRNVGSPELSKP